MADAWGGSWGTAWGNSWGSTGGITLPVVEPTPGGGLPRNWRSTTGRSIGRAELDRAVHALRALRSSTSGLKKRKNREIAAEVAAKVSQAIGIIEDVEVTPPGMAALTASLETVASARKPAIVMAELAALDTQVAGILQYLALLQDDEDAAVALLMVM